MDPDLPQWEQMEFTKADIDSGHFWYTNCLGSVPSPSSLLIHPCQWVSPAWLVAALSRRLHPSEQSLPTCPVNEALCSAQAHTISTGIITQWAPGMWSHGAMRPLTRAPANHLVLAPSRLHPKLPSRPTVGTPQLRRFLPHSACPSPFSTHWLVQPAVVQRCEDSDGLHVGPVQEEIPAPKRTAKFPGYTPLRHRGASTTTTAKAHTHRGSFGWGATRGC